MFMYMGGGYLCSVKHPLVSCFHTIEKMWGNGEVCCISVVLLKIT